MSLRPYQLRAKADLREALRRSRSAVLRLPTGAGKTVVAGDICTAIISRGMRCTYVVPSREILSQTHATLQAFMPGQTIGVEAAGWPSVPWADMTIGMAQSMARRPRLRDRRVDVVIIDEAHRCRARTWETVIGFWPRAILIGLTATPERLDGRGLAEFFDTLVDGASVNELIDDGYLAPVRTFSLPSDLSTDGVRRDRNGEYSAKELGRRVTAKTIAAAANAYHRHTPGQPAIFFGVDTSHSRRVAAQLSALGYRAEHVDGRDTSGRRDAVMNGLRDGAVDVVCNCNLISEGFDAPGCDVIIMGAPTRSITRYLQQAGRCMRPRVGKTAVILDLAGNAYYHGLATDAREWSLEDGFVRQRKPRRPRKCPVCETLYYGRRCDCCGHVAEVQEAEIDEREVDLKEVKNIKRRKGKLNAQQIKTRLREIRQSEDRVAGLQQFVAEQGYSPGYVGATLARWSALNL